MMRMVELVHCRYQCGACGDVIESRGHLVRCSCGAISVDAQPGDPALPRRISGTKENLISLCVWRTENGAIYREGESQ